MNYQLIEYEIVGDELGDRDKLVAIGNNLGELIAYCQEHYGKEPGIEEKPVRKPDQNWWGNYYVIYPSDVTIIGRYH